MALTLERHELEVREETLEPLKLVGLLSSSMVHEINNHLTATEQAIRASGRDYKSIDRNASQLTLEKRQLSTYGAGHTGNRTFCCAVAGYIAVLLRLV